MPKANDSSSIQAILAKHLPPQAIAYAFLLWQQSPFLLKLTKSRQSKVGDFSCRHNSTQVQITLNHDLNPYLFLLTYVHEVAHLRVYLAHGRRAEAHGREWKDSFKLLLAPMLHESIFPDDILLELRRHMVNPKASSFADVTLTHRLRAYDANRKPVTLLSALPEGSIFKLQGRYFKKGKLRRTRVLCLEMKSKRNYLVPAEAEVSDVQLALL
jgi:SprT protein